VSLSVVVRLWCGQAPVLFLQAAPAVLLSMPIFASHAFKFDTHHAAIARRLVAHSLLIWDASTGGLGQGPVLQHAFGLQTPGFVGSYDDLVVNVTLLHAILY
jgi:hypothetical protein